jgi:cytoskeletal protein CcmA (bactofilin family)
MSFRKYGGTQFASSHNIVKSNVNTTDSFYVTKNVGQPNTYINFESDISGNVHIYGDLDISGNLNVSGDIDCSGNLHVQENIDCSGNLNVQENIDCSGNVNIDGDVDINGKLHVKEDIDCSGNVNIDGSINLNNGSNKSTIFQSGAPLTIQNNSPSGYIYITTSAGANGITVFQNGYVGINNAVLNNSYVLNVNGTGNFSDAITTITPANQLDSSSKVPTTAWVQGLISSGGYATLAGNNTWTGSNIFTLQVTALSYNAPSDYRIKTDVTPLDDKFTVDKLRPVTYNNTKLDKQDIGLIAHELQEVYPFLVTGEKDGENLQSVNYTGLIAILIKEIQELKERVKKLEEK